MELLKLGIAILLSLFLVAGATGQQSTTGSINEGTIAEQFDYVVKKSSNWNDNKGQAYEVIRRNMFFTLKSHAVDSINSVRAKLSNARTEINNQQREIDQLKTNLSQTDETLKATQADKDSISFFGVAMSKGGYKFLMWSIIALLGAALAFFIFRFKNSHVLTREAKKRLAKVENEFLLHKKNALEKEQKIMRKLQDEINKRKD